MLPEGPSRIWSLLFTSYFPYLLCLRREHCLFIVPYLRYKMVFACFVLSSFYSSNISLFHGLPHTVPSPPPSPAPPPFAKLICIFFPTHAHYILYTHSFNFCSLVQDLRDQACSPFSYRDLVCSRTARIVVIRMGCRSFNTLRYGYPAMPHIQSYK